MNKQHYETFFVQEDFIWGKNFPLMALADKKENYLDLL